MTLAELRDSRTIVRLLAATVALLTLLVVMLAIGGAWAFGQYRQLSAQVKESTGLDSLQSSVRELSELTAKLPQQQEALAGALGSRAAATQKRIAALEERRNRLSGMERGLIDKSEQMIKIQQLMVDEMLTLLSHFASTQASVATVILPDEAATGGSGKERKEKK